MSQNGFVQTSQPLRRVPLVQTISQSVVPHSDSVQSVVPLRSGQIVQTVSQVVPSQPLVPQSNVVQPTVEQSVESVVPEVVASQPVAPVAPVVPLRNVPLVTVSEPQVVASTSVVAQPGLVGPAVSLRNGRLVHTTPNQPVVTLRRSSVFQPVLSQSNVPFRSVPQPPVPVNQGPTPVVPQPFVPTFRNSRIVENTSNQGVVSQPFLSRYNVFPSQLVGVQSPQVAPQVVSQVAPQVVSQVAPQVVPQVYRTQSVVSHYSVPRVSVTPVVTQNFAPQPVVSQPVLSQYAVPFNGVFSSQNVVSQPVFPAVPNLFRYNEPYVNVVRPAQNPEYINQ